MPTQPGNTLSHYRLVEKIGEGGNGCGVEDRSDYLVGSGTYRR